MQRLLLLNYPHIFGHVRLKILKILFNSFPSSHQQPMANGILLNVRDVTEWKKLFELNLFIFCCTKLEIKTFCLNSSVDLFDLFHFYFIHLKPTTIVKYWKLNCQGSAQLLFFFLWFFIPTQPLNVGHLNAPFRYCLSITIPCYMHFLLSRFFHLFAKHLKWKFDQRNNVLFPHRTYNSFLIVIGRVVAVCWSFSFFLIMCLCSFSILLHSFFS